MKVPVPKKLNTGTVPVHTVPVPVLTSAVDPHSFYVDPDPAVFLNADPDPGGKMNADPDPQPWYRYRYGTQP